MIVIGYNIFVGIYIIFMLAVSYLSKNWVFAFPGTLIVLVFAYLVNKTAND